MEKLLPIFRELLDRKVIIHIITKDPAEHDEFFRYQTTNEILVMAELGIKITLEKSNFHRKLTIIDRVTLWEGSLNILSQNCSREIMRRIEGEEMAEQMLHFLKPDLIL